MKLTDLQSRLKALVAAAPLLVSRPVLVEDKDNLTNLLEVTLQSQSLAVTITASSGQAKAGALPRRNAWEESFDVVIHRGLVDADDVPSTIAVLDELRPLLHGADVLEGQSQFGTFTCSRHDMREGGDGTYARVLVVQVSHSISPTS